MIDGKKPTGLFNKFKHLKNKVLAAQRMHGHPNHKDKVTELIKDDTGLNDVQQRVIRMESSVKEIMEYCQILGLLNDQDTKTEKDNPKDKDKPNEEKQRALEKEKSPRRLVRRNSLGGLTLKIPDQSEAIPSPSKKKKFSVQYSTRNLFSSNK